MSRRPLALTAIEFADRAGVPLVDEANAGQADDEHGDHDDDNESDDDSDDDYDPDVDDDNIAGVDIVTDNADGDDDGALVALDDANNAELEMDLEMHDESIDEHNDEDENKDDEDANAHDDANANEEEEIANANAEDEEDEKGDPIDIDARMDAAYGPRTGKCDLRARKPRDYGHIHTTLESTMFTQHSVRKGLKMFGETSVDAVRKELTQLHERGVLSPKELDEEERKATLQYLMFLKQKRDGTVKGRGCADGRKQREHTTKEEASSPTVAIESVMLSCVIDAKENRDVGTVDLPGAFMQADMDSTVHMKLEGKMAELLVRIDPKLYCKYICIEKGRQVLYVQLM
jgi:hypothetical protein